MNKILKAIRNPKRIILFLIDTKLGRILSDKVYLKIKYKLTFGKKLNLDNPKTFNEKLQWLKLYDRNSEYNKLVDKYEVKKYVADIIGEKYIIPTLGVYEKFDEIDFNNLPSQFVIKCTHDSGGLVICKDKSKLNIKEARKKINKCLKRNYYYWGREWPYKNVKPRIIIEKYMEENDIDELKDYKFFTFNGKIECIQVDYERFINHKRAFYDTRWKRLKFTTCYPTDYSTEIECPKSFNEMKMIAKKIVDELKLLTYSRIDLYTINNKVYFGEITFYHGSGFERFEPQEWDYKLGKYIKLGSKNE